MVPAQLAVIMMMWHCLVEPPVAKVVRYYSHELTVYIHSLVVVLLAVRYHTGAAQRDTAVVLVENLLLALGEIHLVLDVLHVFGGTAVMFEGNEFVETELHDAEKLVVRQQTLHSERECARCGPHTCWGVKMALLEEKHLASFQQVKQLFLLQHLRQQGQTYKQQ